MNEKYPWICPDHPKGQVVHTYDSDYFCSNGLKSHKPIQHNHKYECAVCGLRLSEFPPKRLDVK